MKILRFLFKNYSLLLPTLKKMVNWI